MNDYFAMNDYIMLALTWLAPMALCVARWRRNSFSRDMAHAFDERLEEWICQSSVGKLRPLDICNGLRRCGQSTALAESLARAMRAGISLDPVLATLQERMRESCRWWRDRRNLSHHILIRTTLVFIMSAGIRGISPVDTESRQDRLLWIDGVLSLAGGSIAVAALVWFDRGIRIHWFWDKMVTEAGEKWLSSFIVNGDLKRGLTARVPDQARRRLELSADRLSRSAVEGIDNRSHLLPLCELIGLGLPLALNLGVMTYATFKQLAN